MTLHHPQTHKRPTFKTPPPPPAAATNSTATTNNTGAFVTIPTSEYSALIRQLNAVKTILTTSEPTWTPTHRVAAAVLYLEREPVGNAIPSSHDPNTLAAALNISIGTARTTLQQMAAANVVGYRKVSTPINRYGEPLEHGVKMDRKHGDTWRNSVAVTLPAQPVIKPLTTTPTQEKDRTAKKQQRDELKHLQAKLAALECPGCGTVGHLKIVCGECGCFLDTATDKSESDLSIETPITISATDETSCEQFANGPAAANELLNESPTTPPTIEAAAAATDKSDSDLSIKTPDKSKIDVCINENSKIDVSTFGTEKRVTHDATPTTTNKLEVTPPAANITPAQLITLIGNKGQFIATKYHSKQRANSGPAIWLNGLAALDTLEKGHNITLDSAGQFAIIDIDAGAGEFATPPNAPVIYRVNAPDRAKFIVRCDDARTIAKRKNATGTREIEVKSEAVVIGIHETGAQILCKHNGEPMPTMSMAQIDALVNSFVPEPTPTASAKTVTPLSVPKAKPNASAEGDVRAAISWWNEQPANIAEVERLIASCPTKGKAFAIRDEATPSTVYRPAHDGHNTPTWRDFGAGISRDAFDMFILLTGRDKRRFVGEVMREWRAANMRPTAPAAPTMGAVESCIQTILAAANDISAGNPYWIAKSKLSADDVATIAAQLPAGMQLHTDNPLSYIARAAA